jgi:hypothetical protein
MGLKPKAYSEHFALQTGQVDFLKKPVSSEAWTVQMTLDAFDDL